MDRNYFSFTVGYAGNHAVVDKQAMTTGKKLSISNLLENGQYKSAFCRALYENDKDAQELILKSYNEISNSSYSDTEYLKRLFGVFSVPEGISKTTLL